MLYPWFYMLPERIFTMDVTFLKFSILPWSELNDFPLKTKAYFLEEVYFKHSVKSRSLRRKKKTVKQDWWYGWCSMPVDDSVLEVKDFSKSSKSLYQRLPLNHYRLTFRMKLLYTKISNSLVKPMVRQMSYGPGTELKLFAGGSC